jgi:hypothetical protein
MTLEKLPRSSSRLPGRAIIIDFPARPDLHSWYQMANGMFTVGCTEKSSIRCSTELLPTRIGFSRSTR